MDGFAVIIRAAVGEPLAERQAAAIAAEAGGSLAYDSATGAMRLSVAGGDGLDAQQALTQAAERFLAAVRHHAGAQAGIRDLRVLPWEEFEAETLRPGTPRGGLAGAAEASEILGVSRQRLAELRKDHKDFPAPVENLKSGPVWDRAELEGWERTWERRRTGRPKSA